ncbi:MAG: hypothetical protein PHU25_07560 [Deltaproteobacteria bacterium]|nr:hypothetical protein [Deltaproteobacteria bacterium]
MGAPVSARRTPFDIGAPGWLLLVAAVWEVLAHRLTGAAGSYGGEAVGGLVRGFAGSGIFAVNVVGITALVLACVSLPRLANNPGFAPLPSRLVLMLASPLVLPVICVAVFRPVSPWLVFMCYLAAAGLASYIAVVAAIRPIGGGPRRLLLALALVQTLGALELMARIFDWFAPNGSFAFVPRRAYLFSEVLFVVSPVFAFLVLVPGRLADFARRPHVPALIVATAAAFLASVLAWSASDAAFLEFVAFRTLGVTMSIPGGAVVYTLSLFFGVLLAGTLFIPSRRWPVDDGARRTGLGLAAVWLAGLQPTHPYQTILMIAGFMMLARGLVGEAPSPYGDVPDSGSQVV